MVPASPVDGEAVSDDIEIPRVLIPLDAEEAMLALARVNYAPRADSGAARGSQVSPDL